MTAPEESRPAPAQCSLCLHSAAHVVDSIRVETLKLAYRKMYEVVLPDPGVERLDLLHCANCGLRYFSPPFVGDSAFYAAIQKLDWYYRDEKPEYAIARRHIKSEAAVLEIGAGKGAFAIDLPCRSYVGLETSPEAIELARERSITLFAETIEAHASRVGCAYDIVCAFQVLEHIPDPRSFLTHAAQCLRPGGRLIVAVPSEDSFASISYWDVLNMPPHHITRWSDACLRNVAQLIGLSLVAIEHEPLDPTHARLFARYAFEYGMARKRGHTPRLLDPWMRQWWLRSLSQLAASVLKHAFARPELSPVGHSVVAIYERRA
jgi:SAM-dependent methyltransferase